MRAKKPLDYGLGSIKIKTETDQLSLTLRVFKRTNCSYTRLHNRVKLRLLESNVEDMRATHIRKPAGDKGATQVLSKRDSGAKPQTSFRERHTATHDTRLRVRTGSHPLGAGKDGMIEK